jgi:hypothetical protein
MNDLLKSFKSLIHQTVVLKEATDGEFSYTLVFDNNDEFWILKNDNPIWRSSDFHVDETVKEWNTMLSGPDKINKKEIDKSPEKMKALPKYLVAKVKLAVALSYNDLLDYKLSDSIKKKIKSERISDKEFMKLLQKGKRIKLDNNLASIELGDLALHLDTSKKQFKDISKKRVKEIPMKPSPQMFANKVIDKVKEKLSAKKIKKWNAKSLVTFEIYEGKIDNSLENKKFKNKDIPEKIIKKLQDSVDDQGYSVISVYLKASISPGSKGSFDEAPEGPAIQDIEVEKIELNDKQDTSLKENDFEFMFEYLEAKDFDPIK